MVSAHRFDNIQNAQTPLESTIDAPSTMTSYITPGYIWIPIGLCLAGLITSTLLRVVFRGLRAISMVLVLLFSGSIASEYYLKKLTICTLSFGVLLGDWRH